MNQTVCDPLGEELTFLLLYFPFKTVKPCQCELGFLVIDRERDQFRILRGALEDDYTAI